MQAPAIVNLLAVIGKGVIVLMLAAGGWTAWIALQNWQAISVSTSARPACSRSARRWWRR